MSLFSMKARDGTEAMEAIYSGGDWRILGSRPTPEGTRATFPTYRAGKNPVIPRDQWVAVNRPRTEVPILDQDGRGSCVGQGAATAMMLARSIADLAHQPLSAPYIYALINGGQDNGAIPGDAARLIMQRGVCLLPEFPESKYLASQIPASAHETALRFRALEVYRCMNFDEAVSAFLVGFSLFDTVCCGPQFNNLSAEGVPPVTRGPGNHCVSWGDELRRSVAGKWISQRRNSWGYNWGVDGCYYQAEEHCTQQGQYYECWAIKDVADDPEGPHTIPVAPPSQV
jgi:hypothetical protein